MHFVDYTVILVLALVLFGPKKLPDIARQIGKVMAELRRASNEFKLQIDDEMRVIEQQERQKKLEAAAAASAQNSTPAPVLPESTTDTAEGSAESIPEYRIPEHHIEDGIEDGVQSPEQPSADHPVVIPPSIGETVSSDTDWMPVAPPEMVAAAEVEPHPVYAEALAAERRMEEEAATNHDGAHSDDTHPALPAEASTTPSGQPTQADAPESAQVTASHG